MEFTRIEKLAIVQALDAILLADGRIHKNEVDFIANVNVQFRFYPEDIDEARGLDINKAGSTLRSMSFEKKEFFKGLCVTMAHADGEMDINELKLVSLFFAMLN